MRWYQFILAYLAGLVCDEIVRRIVARVKAYVITKRRTKREAEELKEKHTRISDSVVDVKRLRRDI